MYNSGEKVTIKKDLQVGELYFMENGVNFDTISEEMTDFLGKEVTIERIRYGGYRIKEDEGQWTWTDEMFEQAVVVE